MDAFKKWLYNPGAEHVVDFYASDTEIVSNLAGYITNSINNGDFCIVIAKPSHIGQLYKELEHDILHSKNLQLLNAVTVMEGFVIDGRPDRQKFMDSVGGCIKIAAQHDKSVRVFGEIVALLWEQGHKQAVMEIEKLWHDLHENYEFSHFCAYPAELLNNEDKQLIQSFHNFDFQPQAA